MKSSYRFYRGCYHVARALFSIAYGFNVLGKENIPKGAAMICANHSSVVDPIFIAFAFGIDCHIRVIAKAELYKVPVLSAVIKKLGAISVDRGILDMDAVKITLGCLKNGEKVAIFPEGTRKPVKDAIAAKSGAVKIAERAKVPIIPMFIPRKKHLFSKVSLVIGEPYFIEAQSIRRTSDEYSLLADVMMSKIEALNPAGIRNSEFGVPN